MALSRTEARKQTTPGLRGLLLTFGGLLILGAWTGASGWAGGDITPAIGPGATDSSLSHHCGNGVCGANESCSSCPQDCGPCLDASAPAPDAAMPDASVPPDASGGSSGSGGSGGAGGTSGTGGTGGT